MHITEQTYYLWRMQCGGTATNQLKEFKRLQKDYERLSIDAFDLTPDKRILKEAAK